MKRLLLAAAFCAAATPALALFDQQAPGLVEIVDPASPAAALGTASHPLNTTGTFTGTIGGFPGGTGGVIGTPVTAVTTVTAGSTQTLPAGTSVIASNPGAVMAFCQLGATATVNSQPIPSGGGWFDFTVGSATQITCVTASSTTTVNTFGGGGIATGTGGGGGAGGGGAITAPLGTQTIGASVAVTPATSSVWGGPITGPLGTQAIGASVAVTPATSSSWPTTIGGPLGTQAIAGSVAVTPATSSVWSTTNGPNQASITGNITVVDSGVTCASTAGGQTLCTGSPTAGSFVSGQINGAGCIGVSSALSGGTATAAMSTEISQDNVNFYPRGLFLDGKNAPIWTNNITGGVFGGQTPGGGVLYYRVRASTLTTLTGTPSFAIVILPSQAACVNYDGNLPTAANGSGSVASVNIQGGGGSALNVGTNQIQQAGVALAAPTAAGTTASGNIQGVQGVTGGVPMPVTASLGGFTPSSSGARMTPMTVLTTDTTATLPTGAVVVVSNVGLTNIMYCNVNSLAAQTSDQPIAPGGGWFAFTIPVGPTQLHCISPAGGTTANGVGGSGLATGTGGGGGAAGSSGNVFQANLFYTGSTSSAATTQILAASGSTVVYLVNYGEQTDTAAGAAATFQIVTGTGTNCATSQVALTPVWNFPAGQGIQEGSLGVLGVSAAGAALCTKTTTGNQVNWRIGVVQQ